MKKYLLSGLACISLLIALSGCEREVQSVEWYKEHDAERMEVVLECKADADRLNKTQNCINAKQANRELIQSRNKP
ncbi:MAG: EexN family lipoprotein [Zoogloeaceae bacterium]|nr:EexN family lipoprotein [Zoogloeaceae bacterium]